MSVYKKKRLVIYLIVVATLILTFLAWYQDTYTMDKTSSFEINTTHFNKKIVIATQGSAFKNAITSNIINHYKNDSIYIKIIDIDGLHDIKPKKFDAIVILHTWESWQPPQSVKLFLNRTRLYYNKIIVFTTSGSGNSKMEDIDAVTGESNLNNTKKYSDIIINKLRPLLK